MNVVVRTSLRRTLIKSCNVGGNAKIEFEKKKYKGMKGYQIRFLFVFLKERINQLKSQKNRNLESHFLDTLSKKVFTHLST